MGLLENNNVFYLNVFKGDETDPKPGLVNKKRGVKVRGVEGKIVGLKRRDGEYNGKPTIQFQLMIQDDQLYSLQINGESFLGLSLFQSLANVNLNNPVSVTIYKNDKGNVYFGLWQNGKQVKSVENFKQPQKVQAGKQVVWVWDDVIPEIEKIAALINSKNGVATTEVEEIETETVGRLNEDEIPF